MAQKRGPVQAVPILSLTTDFGVGDHFVGAMKGVILGIEPRAQIVDITHQVAPFAICEAAFTVAEAARCFPIGSVHVVVVDPGVGTSRRALVAEAGGQFFVAPDNGVLEMIYARGKHKVREISADQFFRHPVSQTFHGRDVFAPVAAHLARGAPFMRFGKIVLDYVRGGFAEPAACGDRRWTGCILKADRFGNLITNFEGARFGALAFEMQVGRRKIGKTARSYAEGKPGELFVIEGSAGYLEIATNLGSAANLTGACPGAEVVLVLR